MQDSKNARSTQIANSQNWLAQSYIELLAKWPDKKISISLICDNAGVGRQTFYRYFSSKQDLLSYEFEKATSTFWQRLDALNTDLSHEKMLLISYELWIEHPYLKQLILSDDWHDWLNQRYINTWKEAYSRYFEASSMSDYDTEIFIGAIHGLFYHWLKTGMKESPQQLLVMATKVVNFSVRPTKQP